MLDDLKTSCPNCGGTVRFSLDDVSKERTVRCSGGCDVVLQDEGGGAAKSAKSLRDLDRSLKGLNRTINFKL